jgi:hypothetical protein
VPDGRVVEKLTFCRHISKGVSDVASLGIIKCADCAEVPSQAVPRFAESQQLVVKSEAFSVMGLLLLNVL